MADAAHESPATGATGAKGATDATITEAAALPPVREVTHARIPTAVGSFQLRLYANDVDDKEHLALVAGEIGDGDSVLVRVHSECFTGEVIGSLRCDCGPQLARAIDLVAGEGRGVIVYLRQEGRGIGLADKLRAYNLQDDGLDTVDANLALGHGPDDRDYTLAAAILHALGVRSVRLLTNNPAKVASLAANGLPVVERVPMGRFETAENAGYLRAKVERMGHLGGGGEE